MERQNFILYQKLTADIVEFDDYYADILTRRHKACSLYQSNGDHGELMSVLHTIKDELMICERGRDEVFNQRSQIAR
jgi:hypothetical protein